ncbi:hypothetical protein [Limnovirga soli]|jgi:hypothetical protein|uniref:Uncharacterized protein n=1 Tax=Limnovirga soli TaxID=2656915 RepID=A0A8J8FFG7_9BACT|nr:hypothetical protein [Limnovirga soli]NNV54946.1 hypothetical protein [Limnovirga soli]
MQFFKTNKKYFWSNELKSWLWTIAFAALVYFVLNYFYSITRDNFIIGVVVIFLRKLGDILTQYHVSEIQIDGQKKEMILILNSRMSGEKIKIYGIEQITSELIHYSGWKRYLYSPFTLNIFLNPKDKFVITNRFGFTLDTLTSVDKILKSTKAQA